MAGWLDASHHRLELVLELDDSTGHTRKENAELSSSSTNARRGGQGDKSMRSNVKDECLESECRSTCFNGKRIRSEKAEGAVEEV